MMGIRVADVLDIAVITFLIYSVVVWFKRTTSRAVVVGILLLTGLYFLARRLELYMTSLVFHAFFAILLVALIVVFQEDLRRGFERLAVWGTFRERRRLAGFPTMDALVEGISTLASSNVGALIVLKGREPLDRHVEGGIPLYGRFSKPLLYSIFDPHSPGHDGAMLIEGERIAKFGTHLPLSKNLQEVGALGTRHAAALGMSECSDALVVVVSEERGVMSVAEGGRLDAMGSAAELKGRLERFTVGRFPHPQEPDWQRFFRENARIKVLSVALAVMSWFLFSYRSESLQRTFAVPIEYRNLPIGWAVEGQKPAEAMVTLSGSERAFNLLNPVTLLVSLDLSEVREGMQRVPIEEENLRRPANLTVYRIEPSGILLEAHQAVSVSVPVRVQTKGELPPHLKLAGLKVVPISVRLRVPSTGGAAPDFVTTEPVDLSPVTGNTLVRSRLMVPASAQLSPGADEEVSVTVEVLDQGENR